MTPTPAQQRWLIALLVAVFLLDLTFSAASGHEELVFTLSGSVAMLICVYYGVTRPGPAAFTASLALLASSILIFQAQSYPVSSVGIESVKLSEVLAGGALVVLLAWRARPSVAIAGTAALVTACLAAVDIRSGRLIHYGSPNSEFLPGSFEVRSLFLGFVLLVVCVGAGTYLRLSGQQRVDSELRKLIRRQWPLAAALFVLLLFDIAEADNMFRVVVVGGAAIAGVCAFFAPRAPVQAALTAAVALAVGMVPYAVATVIEMARPLTFFSVRRGLSLEPFSLTQVAATMALIAFVVRYARPAPAAWSTFALIAANLGGLLDVYRHGLRDDLVLPMGFLLVISMATGLYFRARDRERSQTVKVAVTGAQQAERLALARELHDVVAHHVTGIVVQAQAARLVADREPRVAVSALEKIENSGTEALTAMRMLVGSLRGAEPAGGSTAASQATSDLAADIRALVEQFPGPTVHLELTLPERLPDEVGRSVLRLVQESLTNISKHAAGALNVHVGVTTGRGDAGDELHVFVTDDGTARRSHPVGGSGGYGLIGMRERVELLGGSFSAGPGADGGWVVKVALPLRSKS